MADTSKKQGKNSLEEIGVYAPPELREAKYSNAIQVNVSSSDIALNFIYVNPNDEPMGTLVSRVAIPHEQAEQLSSTLAKALKAVKEEKKK